LPCCGLGGVGAIIPLKYRRFLMAGNGMAPALPAGEHVILTLRPYDSIADGKRRGVILFTSGDGNDYLSRVVGLPGDHLQFTIDSVIVNGPLLPMEEVRTDGDRTIYLETNGNARYEVAYPKEKAPTLLFTHTDVVVPEGHVFVLGDNRNAAYDS